MGRRVTGSESAPRRAEVLRGRPRPQVSGGRVSRRGARAAAQALEATDEAEAEAEDEAEAEAEDEAEAAKAKEEADEANAEDEAEEAAAACWAGFAVIAGASQEMRQSGLTPATTKQPVSDFGWGEDDGAPLLTQARCARTVIAAAGPVVAKKLHFQTREIAASVALVQCSVAVSCLSRSAKRETSVHPRRPAARATTSAGGTTSSSGADAGAACGQAFPSPGAGPSLGGGGQGENEDDAGPGRREAGESAAASAGSAGELS